MAVLVARHLASNPKIFKDFALAAFLVDSLVYKASYKESYSLFFELVFIQLRACVYQQGVFC